jgi:hypothetical protein
MNGYNWLVSRLSKQGITCQMRDNAFLRISDWEKAQQLSDHIRVEDLHQVNYDSIYPGQRTGKKSKYVKSK